MKTLMMTTGLLSMTMIGMAQAGERVDKTLDAASNGYVEIEHVSGFARVKGWSRNEVKVTGELGDRTEAFVFERDGNEVVIHVEVKKGRRGWSNWDDDDGDRLEIYIPENSKVSYTSTNARVEISEIFGGADISTVNGEIDAKELAGRLRLEAVNGDIDAKDLSGNIKIETVNGDIRDRSENAKEATYDSVNGDIEVFTHSSELRAETVNGDIELSLNKVDLLNLSTVNGSIDARMKLARQGDVRANSVGGSIDLYFQPDVSARFDIEGHAGGRISNNLTNDKVQKAKYGPSRWLEFSMNGGEAKVDVSTVSGRVRLDKR